MTIVTDDAIARFLANNEVTQLEEGERSSQGDDFTERSMRDAENNYNDRYHPFYR